MTQANESYDLYLSLYLNQYGLSSKQAALLASYAVQRDYQVKRVKEDYEFEISRIPIRWYWRIEAAQNSKRDAMKTAFLAYNEIIERKLKEYQHGKDTMVGNAPSPASGTNQEPESTGLFD